MSDEKAIVSLQMARSDISEIDEAAKSVGLSRSAYMRGRLRGASSDSETKVLAELAAALRKTAVSQGLLSSALAYLLEDMQETDTGSIDADLAASVEAELKRARELGERTLALEAKVAKLLRRHQRGRP